MSSFEYWHLLDCYNRLIVRAVYWCNVKEHNRITKLVVCHERLYERIGTENRFADLERYNALPDVSWKITIWAR